MSTNAQNILCKVPPYQDAFIFQDPHYGIRYYSNINISDSSTILSTVKTVIIAIHGASRDANDYYSAMCGAAQIQGYNVLNKDIIIIAPRFMESKDLNGSTNELYWTSDWNGGANSVVPKNNPSLQVSAYTVIDTMIKLLFIDGSDLYPNLINVTVAGHSAGAQFAMRYALTSTFEFDSNDNKHSIKYVVANPSSFSWLDSRRWINDQVYRELTQTEIEQCSGYNKWKYGWDPSSDFPEYITDQNLTLEIARKQYVARNVTYLHGTNDVCNHIENSTCSDHDMDTSCNALYQGQFRLERGINFLRSLQEIYGTFEHRIDFVPFVGHDHVDMFQHPNGRRAIF